MGFITGSSGNLGSSRQRQDKTGLGTGSGHLEGSGLHRGATGLHRGTRIGALLGDFFPLKTDRNDFSLDHLSGDHPQIVFMGWTGIGVLDPACRSTTEKLRLLHGDPESNRETLNRYLINFIEQAIGGEPSESPQHAHSPFFKCGYGNRLPSHDGGDGMVTDPIRPAELTNPETLPETINQRPVYGRTGFHQPFRGELPATLHLLVSFLFRRYQKKRRGGGFFRCHLIQK